VDDQVLAADRPDILDEVFDGEAVLINMRTGCYYSLDPFATELWRTLAPGRRTVTASRIVAANHGVETEEIMELLSPFVARLREEGLLVGIEREVEEQADGAEGQTPPEWSPGVPKMERFDDIADLLLIDPIHDVDLDGDGWPVIRAEVGSGAGGSGTKASE
jgi:hypothetical protein